MKKLLFVDDLRTMTVAEETAFGLVTYARTLEAAMSVNWQEYDEIWLDHDLGKDANGIEEVDVRAFAVQIEELSLTENMDKFSFRIVTSNAVGRKWLEDALRFCNNVEIEYN